MSIQISRLVWDAGPTKRDQRFVLLAIAEHADEDGNAWPSIRQLCSKTLFCQRTVLDAIKSLEADGWLTAQHEAGKRSHYRVQVARFRPSTGAKSAHAENAPVQSIPKTGAIPAIPPHPAICRTIIEPSYTLTPPEKPAKIRKATRLTVPDAAVEEIYRQYPRHVKRPEAKRAISEAILRVATADCVSQDEAAQKLLNRTRNYSTHVKRVGLEMQYCPYPATWFNGERYDDDDCLEQEANGAGVARYTDPATLYDTPEYQAERRSA